MIEKIFILKYLFILTSIWGLCILFLWFRPRIEIFWKIVATLLLAFYIIFFYEKLKIGFEMFQKDCFTALFNFIKEFLVILYILLVLVWPVSLIMIFYKSDDIAAERLLKFMCIFTLLTWTISILYILYNKNVDIFFYDMLKKILPAKFIK